MSASPTATPAEGRGRRAILVTGLLAMALTLVATQALLGWRTPESPTIALLASVGLMVVFAVTVLVLSRIQNEQADALRRLEIQAQTAQQLADAAARERDAALARVRAEERNRIARDMHDSLSHQLAVIALHAGALAMREDLSPEAVREAARTVRDSAEGANSELRLVLEALRRVEPETDGEAARSTTLEDVVDRAQERGLNVQWSLDGVSEEELTVSPIFTRTAVVRIAEEAMINAMKHAPGETLYVCVRRHGRTLDLVARNRVIEERCPSALSSEYGLIGVQERAESLGGSARWRVDDGQFILEVTVPW